MVKCSNVSEEHSNSIFKVTELSSCVCKRLGGGGRESVSYVELLANQQHISNLLEAMRQPKKFTIASQVL